MVVQLCDKSNPNQVWEYYAERSNLLVPILDNMEKIRHCLSAKIKKGDENGRITIDSCNLPPARWSPFSVCQLNTCTSTKSIKLGDLIKRVNVFLVLKQD